MLMTIRVPDDVIGLKYTKKDEKGYMSEEDMRLTQIVAVEMEPADILTKEE